VDAKTQEGPVKRGEGAETKLVSWTSGDEQERGAEVKRKEENALVEMSVKTGNPREKKKIIRGEETKDQRRKEADLSSQHSQGG